LLLNKFPYSLVLFGWCLFYLFLIVSLAVVMYT
jgi:hypothetical protein